MKKRFVPLVLVFIIIAANLLLIWKFLYYRQVSVVSPTIHSWQSSKEAIESAIWNINDYLENDQRNRQELLDGVAINIAVCQSHLQCLDQTTRQLLLADKKYRLFNQVTTQHSSIMREIDDGLYILSVFIDELQDVSIDMNEEQFHFYLQKIKNVLDAWLNQFNRYDISSCKTPQEVALAYSEFIEKGAPIFENAFHFLVKAR